MFKARWLVVACAFIVLANAAPLDKDSDAKILNNDYTIDEKGNYKFSFKTSNGITREETGLILNKDEPNEYIFVIGSYTYLNPEGKEEKIEYIAGTDGYNINLLPKPDFVKMSEYGLPANAVATLLGK